MALEVPDLHSGNPQLQKALQKIVRLEQKPLDMVDEKIGKVDNKLQLIKDLKTKFSKVRESITPFKSVDSFRDLKSESSHPDIVSASSIDKLKAKPGMYEFEVKDLATSASLMTTGVPDRDKTEIGVGYISFKTGEGESRDVYVNSQNNTLDGIARTINEAGLGIRAQVVNDGTDSSSPWRLILSGDKGGWRNDLSFAQFNFLDGDLDVDHYRSREAKSAVIYLNGQPMYVDDNAVKDLLPGVVLNLNKAEPGQKVKIEIKPDFEQIQEKSKTFVDNLNEVFKFIQHQSTTDQNSKKDPTKALSGDTSILSMQNRLSSVLQRTLNGADGATVKRLQDIGIVFNRTGTLDYDGAKFQSALENNFDEVAQLISGDGMLNGFANELSRLVDGFTRSGDGFLTLKEKNFQDQVGRLEREKEKKTQMAESRVQKAKMQFGKAEAALENMTNMRNQLAAVMGGG
jgi:flagellar hook-associated protein 2